MTEIPAEDGAHLGVPEDAYHADLGSLSSSGARTLLKSPAQYRYERSHPRHATHFDIGTYVHTLVLGVGADVAVIDADDYRGKAARDARDQAYADGKTPLLRKDAELAETIAAAIRSHDTAATLLNDPEGVAEMSLYWRDAETGVRLRARLDWYVPGIAADVKTTGVTANPREWGSVAAKSRLHFQAAWYIAGLRALGIHDSPGFCFINAEKEPPHLVSMTQLTPRAIELGMQQMRRAVRLYAECVERDEWPAYGNQIHTVDLPGYVYYQEEE